MGGWAPPMATSRSPEGPEHAEHNDLHHSSDVLGASRLASASDQDAEHPAEGMDIVAMEAVDTDEDQGTSSAITGRQTDDGATHAPPPVPSPPTSPAASISPLPWGTGTVSPVQAETPLFVEVSPGRRPG